MNNSPAYPQSYPQPVEYFLPEAACLYVSNLRLFQFRNLADQSVELGAGPVFITGQNGNGKTNLVEAIYLLSGSRSFRTNSAAEYSRWGTNECSVFGRVGSRDGDYEVGILYRRGKREGFLNGETVSSVAELLSKVVVVAFSPSDLGLVKGPPSGRRKFIDRHIVDITPAFLRVLMAYTKALSSKAAVLKSGSATRSDIEPWNHLLAKYGGEIIERRVAFLKRLEERAAAVHAEYASSDGALSLQLESDLLGENRASYSEVMLEHLERVMNKELAQRTTLVGPHRDDVLIQLGGADTRAYASQGQSRSTVLSLKLAVIDLLEETIGESPIILLDDVDSELDAGRGERLFDSLVRRERQILVTGTGNAPYRLKERSDLTVLRVEHGHISSENRPSRISPDRDGVSG